MSRLIGNNAVEPSVNLSDHRPIMAQFSIKINEPVACHTAQLTRAKEKTAVTQLRWVHADLLSYYHLTRVHLQQLLEYFDCHVNSDCTKSDLINVAYDKLVSSLQYCASISVPVHCEGFYEFWWDQLKMNLLNRITYGK
jgi:hypothetical protein